VIASVHIALVGTLLVGTLSCRSNSATTPDAGPIPLPTLSLTPGDFTFVVDGTPRVVMSRNITGETTDEIDALLDQAHAGGSTVIRLHLIHGLGSGVTAAGGVDESWAGAWDQVFDHALAVGLYVVPVFGVWADWNDGTPDLGFANWSANPWNAANGGPAADPGELWQSDSVVRTAWLGWLRQLVDRWQGRPNIAAWETFSELDIATGASEATGAAFAAEAAAIVRAEDAGARPVMASLSALDDWPTLESSDSVDIIQVHVYDEQLDTALIEAVGAMRTEYGKPVLIGESGLSAAAPTGGTATTEPNASLAIRHAIWAGVVSGAMNARGLWWEDGYAIYEPPGLAFVDSYADAEAAAATFVHGLDFRNAAPVQIATSPDVTGAAIGNQLLVVGWLRSVTCSSPAWSCAAPLSGETIVVAAPGSAATWRVTFYDTSTGMPLPDSVSATDSSGSVTVTLPSFADDIAFTLTPAT
jgi:hypothetical protein